MISTGYPKSCGHAVFDQQFILAAVGQHPSLAHQNHPLDFGNNVRGVMRHQHNAHSGLGQPAHGLAQFVLRDNIEAVRRLVKHQGEWVMHQGARDKNPLRFSRGHLGDGSVCQVYCVQPREGRVGFCTCSGST